MVVRRYGGGFGKVFPKFSIVDADVGDGGFDSGWSRYSGPVGDVVDDI